MEDKRTKNPILKMLKISESVTKGEEYPVEYLLKLMKKILSRGSLYV